MAKSHIYIERFIALILILGLNSKKVFTTECDSNTNANCDHKIYGKPVKSSPLYSSNDSSIIGIYHLFYIMFYNNNILHILFIFYFCHLFWILSNKI